MKNEGQINSQNMQIQGLLDRYLNLRSAGNNEAASQPQHLDDDLLSAFAEGNLSEREARPILSHLVECSFCRHVTAELVRLDFALAKTEEIYAVRETSEPSKVSEVLSGILSRIFGTSDGAVFAHHDKEEEEKAKDKSDKTKKED